MRINIFLLFLLFTTTIDLLIWKVQIQFCVKKYKLFETNLKNTTNFLLDIFIKMDFKKKYIIKCVESLLNLPQEP